MRRRHEGILNLRIIATRVISLLVVAALFLSCQKHGERGFVEGRQTFRELLALRDQLTREFHETVGDVSVAGDQQMTVKFVNSPLRSRTAEEKQQRADAVAAFVAKTYRQPVSSVSVEFGSGEAYVGRPAVQPTQ